MKLFIVLSLVAVVFLSACGSSVNTNPSYITVTQTQDVTNTITQQSTITQQNTQTITQTAPPQTIVSTLPPITSIMTSVVTTTAPPVTITITTAPPTVALQPLILGITHINTGANYNSPFTALYTLTIQNTNNAAVNSQALSAYFSGLQGATIQNAQLVTASGGNYIWSQQGLNLLFVNYPNISVAANSTISLVLSLSVTYSGAPITVLTPGVQPF